MDNVDVTLSAPRRELLALAGSGLVALAATGWASSDAAAAELSGSALRAAEQTHMRIVKDFCAAWSTLDVNQVGAFFADDAVYRVIETARPTVGRAAILQLIGTFLQRARKVQFQIHRLYGAGPIVLSERHDHFTSAQGERVFHVAGVFFVKDGKIAEWTDYVIAA